MTEMQLLASIIKGDELRIQMILDKYPIGERDKDIIIGTIAKIEENTIALTKEKIRQDMRKKGEK